jgi:hypothetical protein
MSNVVCSFHCSLTNLVSSTTYHRSIAPRHTHHHPRRRRRPHHRYSTSTLLIALAYLLQVFVLIARSIGKQCRSHLVPDRSLCCIASNRLSTALLTDRPTNVTYSTLRVIAISIATSHHITPLLIGTCVSRNTPLANTTDIGQPHDSCSLEVAQSPSTIDRHNRLWWQSTMCHALAVANSSA